MALKDLAEKSKEITSYNYFTHTHRLMHYPIKDLKIITGHEQTGKT